MTEFQKTHSWGRFIFFSFYSLEVTTENKDPGPLVCSADNIRKKKKKKSEIKIDLQLKLLVVET